MDKMERRRYFRINDRVGLDYRPVSASNRIDYRENTSNVEIEAPMVIQVLNNELDKALDILWKSDASAANALILLNRKLDLLAADLNPAFIRQHDVAEEEIEVNISACGVAFECAEYFNAGQKLDIRIRLKYTRSLVNVVGLVVACEPAQETGEARYLVRIDFVNMSRSAQEALIQHIVKRQSSQIGAEKARDQEPG